MSVPKSVTKINKNGITYTSNVDVWKYYSFELSRAALRDVGKFVTRTFRTSYYNTFKKITGNAGKATKYRVVSSKSTLYPRVEIGLKSNKVTGFYSYFQEFGAKNIPKLGLLTKAVQGNIATIIEIESQYLSALSSEARALSLIEESDMEGDADGED